MLYFKTIEQSLKFHEQFAGTKVKFKDEISELGYIASLDDLTMAQRTVSLAHQMHNDSSIIWIVRSKESHRRATWIKSNLLIDIENETLRTLYFKKGE